MLEDLDLLASRIRQLTELTQSLRDENAALGKSLAQRDSHIRMLRETLAAAQTRVEGVLARLPAGTPPAGEAEGESEVAGEEQSPGEGEASAPGDASPPAAEGADPGARSLYGTT
ncbi:MAG: hypothetical protein QHC78_12770 [Pigmentiphaga sp.]|uniref:hypothetical protein n=1 Tax=Pigmentiphaga sp. TaxID=1977564 RepID=UPI0029AEFF72|nr:hypothetical protein [Pigmentiphaga sp.]MDX3906552.1 hypothetical protein [Pigmentiphaga sp.]